MIGQDSTLIARVTKRAAAELNMTLWQTLCVQVKNESTIPYV